MREWAKFDNDELIAIWEGYIKQEFSNGDPLRQTGRHESPIRLTPIEIIKLVDELMYRLHIKENSAVKDG